MASWDGFWDEIDKGLSSIPGRDSLHKQLFGDVPDWQKGTDKDPEVIKRKGYDGIRAEVARLQDQRRGDMEQTYQMANAKYEPARAALAQIYGDPKTWKL